MEGCNQYYITTTSQQILKKTLAHILSAVYILVLIPNVQYNVQNKNIQKLYKNLFTEAKCHRQTNTVHLSHNCILLQGNGLGINK